MFVADKALLLKCLIDRQHGFAWVDMNPAERRRSAGSAVTGGDYGEDRFTVKADLARSEEWFVSAPRRAHIVLTRDVSRAENINDAGSGAHRFKINLGYRADGGIGTAYSKMQRASRQRHVVNIDRLASGMFECAVMGECCARCGVDGFSHAQAPPTLRRQKRVGVWSRR